MERRNVERRNVSCEPGEGGLLSAESCRPTPALPDRALNLARRILQQERECNGRGRLELQIIMLDGEWYLTLSQPGPVERLGR